MRTTGRRSISSCTKVGGLRRLKRPEERNSGGSVGCKVSYQPTGIEMHLMPLKLWEIPRERGQWRSHKSTNPSEKSPWYTCKTREAACFGVLLVLWVPTPLSAYTPQKRRAIKIVVMLSDYQNVCQRQQQWSSTDVTKEKKKKKIIRMKNCFNEYFEYHVSFFF